MFSDRCFISFALALATALPISSPRCEGAEGAGRAPRIVNIVNFIRLLEPRDESITEERLYQTVVKQIELMQRHNLPGTFLLQYDALTDERYQHLLGKLPTEQFEIGAWWELPQPLVEKAGLTWRGRFPWDWHANVGFASGYTPAEREKLADVYMEEFHAVFGRYPKSVASWFIDAHTLAYLHEKYGIVASANCKDQIGTDGYTLWGGYWNQAYYPSKLNAYMPAQTTAGQIPVPVFRMLGSDPLRQYDTGVGGGLQGVITLEPIYNEGGRDPAWVDWFLNNLANGECLAFNYTQAGQENSFTWDRMAAGLEDQFPKIAAMRDQGGLTVETLAASGEWFRKSFPVTPATAMTFTAPLRDDQRQTFWYNSRFYRVNFVWDRGVLRLRDLHLFDESVESDILRDKVDKSAVEFFTLPLVDGNFWGSHDQQAGLYVTDAEENPLRFSAPQVSQTETGAYQLTSTTQSGDGELIVTMQEDSLNFRMLGSLAEKWKLQLNTASSAELPFIRVDEHSIEGQFRGSSFRVRAADGRFIPRDNGFGVRPNRGRVNLQLDDR